MGGCLPKRNGSFARPRPRSHAPRLPRIVAATPRSPGLRETPSARRCLVVAGRVTSATLESPLVRLGVLWDRVGPQEAILALSERRFPPGRRQYSAGGRRI